MNKKGLSTLLNVIVGFAMFSVIFLFSMVLVYETGDTYVIDVEQQVALDIVGPLAVNETQTAAINTVVAGYKSFAFPYDLFFLLMILSVYTTTVVSVFQTNKQGIFSFFGFIFVGSMMLLIITSYVSDFSSWFMSEIFYNLFDDFTVGIPIITFYLANLGIINFVWWLSLVLIAGIDKNFISKSGEVEA